MGLSTWLVKKLSQYLMKQVGKPRPHLCDFNKISYELRPGDVILIEGHNRISHIVKRITSSPWTHASLYLGRLHDIEDPKVRVAIRKNYSGGISDQLILEAMVGHGNYIDNLTHYKGEHIRICRPTGISHADVQRIIAITVSRLGEEYGTRHFFDLGRFLLGSRFLPKRWRSTLFNRNPTKVSDDICSSLIAKAFMDVKFPILPLVRQGEGQSLEFIHRNSRLFAPCDFDYSPYFNIIKYPIFPMNDPAPYRHLPWNESLLSNDDEGLMSSEPFQAPESD